MENNFGRVQHFEYIPDYSLTNFYGNIQNTEPSQNVTLKPAPRVRPNGLLAKFGLPCQDIPNYDYGQCYSYFANGCYNTCQFVDVGDIEDFMNNEKRKEKSRDAARYRRSRETEIFTDLANALPLSAEQVSQLDKASVMRLAISYLKVRDMVELVPVAEKEEKDDSTDGSMLLKSLEGFIVVLSPEGDFVYLSENVSSFLGIPQIDLMGQNIFEFSHPCDHDEIREVIAGKIQDDNSARSIFIRLKCTLTNKGRSVNLKSASYKVIRCTGHMLKPLKDNKKDDPGKDSSGCFLAVGQPIPHPSNIEAPLPRQTFLTKHGLDMKFIHADDEFMKTTLGYEPEDLLGKSVYEYHHAMDSDAILSAYKCLFSKGQCETQRYRFLAKTGGYIWVVTQATLIYDKVHKPQSIVSVNYVISGLECKDEIYSSFQIESVKSESTGDANNNEDTTKKTPEVPEIVVTEVEEDKHEKVTESVVRRPISNTAKLFGNSLLIKSEAPTRPRVATSEIFGPRTKDMSRGFLTFSEEKPGLTMLKDEPDDLTHLAPVAGDVCVPLDDHPFLTDMLNDILLKDNFAPLLTEEPSDPFISYRDHDPSPQLLSPNFSKTSDSLPSLSSPSDSLLDEDHMSTFMNLQMDDDSELALKAPYIPMDITDDLPLLMPSELMWSSEDKKKQVQLGTSLTNGEGNSSLAHLLSTSLAGKSNLKSSELDDDRSDGQRDHGLETIFNEKGTRKSWTSQNNLKNVEISKTERTQNGKRSSPSNYEQSSKRPKCEPKEKMSSELLQQLMSNNNSRGRPKGKSNWLLDTGGQKAACISQPSDSVLMNLLDPPLNAVANSITRKNISASLEAKKKRQLAMENNRKLTMRKNSLSLLESNGTCFDSFMDLTQHDYEVNAPVQSLLLNGEDLLTALDINSAFS